MLIDKLTDTGGEDKWIELNLRQLDDDLNEDHDQHCNRGEERQPGEDREWRERVGGWTDVDEVVWIRDR